MSQIVILYEHVCYKCIGITNRRNVALRIVCLSNYVYFFSQFIFDKAWNVNLLVDEQYVYIYEVVYSYTGLDTWLLCSLNCISNSDRLGPWCYPQNAIHNNCHLRPLQWDLSGVLFNVQSGSRQSGTLFKVENTTYCCMTSI